MMEQKAEGKLISDMDYIKKGIDELKINVKELGDSNTEDHTALKEALSVHGEKIKRNERDIDILFKRYNKAAGGLILIILSALGYLFSRIL